MYKYVTFKLIVTSKYNSSDLCRYDLNLEQLSVTNGCPFLPPTI